MGLFDLFKKKESVVLTPISETELKKKRIVEKRVVQKTKVLEKIGKFYRTEDGIFHKKYNITGTSINNRPKNWVTVKVGDPVKFRFYKYEGNPAIEVLHKNGPIGNIKAINATQFNSYKDIISGGSVYSAQAQVRRVRAILEIDFLETMAEKTREFANNELMMTDSLSDTRVKRNDDFEDNDEIDRQP